MEENLRRALMITDGELSFLWERPITLAFTTLSVVILASPIVVMIVNKLRGNQTTAKSCGTNKAH